ncbi:UDP-2,3-diacylglucosamine hydrolase [Rubripirellula lacrimiformis]|uniref:UDP-2,3-diacylglucosamine hydrolase n=1 Tax=Rubripirellula lacrimiformis TaxID=1930273 RepID=A0A517NDT1_9BACT|nr:metallophosphoesterase [Rubripirellula lacrimiformis]QDT05285.1 UDP-2,3-diacylglucosamine hydrolase [Rubripirellula lacrimiformis]
MIEVWHDNSIRKVSFVSDLHWLSSRSIADQYSDSIRHAIKQADLCVWGGDLFDFRWSRLENEESSIQEALDWLERWYVAFPEKRFVYLNGNHDAHTKFQDRLIQWAESRNRFTAGIECLRVAQTLWLHGDVIEGGGTSQGFEDYRRLWRHKPVANKFHSGLYDAAIAIRLHGAASWTVHREKATCLRVAKWLAEQPVEKTAGIKRIVFGHTHRRIDGACIDEIEFHNGGAAIKHVPFSPITVDVDPG